MTVPHFLYPKTYPEPVKKLWSLVSNPWLLIADLEQEIECDTDDFQFKKTNLDDARQDTIDTMELLCQRLTEGY